MQYNLAIDIGGSKLLIGIVSSDGDIICSDKKDISNVRSDREIITLITDISDKMMLGCDVAVSSCGVSVPGLTDSEKGEWVFAPYSGITNFPIARLLKEKLKLPVFIENDVNASALAEKHFGICRETDNFFWMTISNGIGGALFLDGKLYKGAFSNAGEIGHVTVVKDGHMCGCGKRGCLEVHASGLSIEREYSSLTNLMLTAKEIVYKAKQGEQAANKVYQHAGRHIGMALSHVSNLLNVEKIVLGGGVSLDYELFKNDLLTEFRRNVFIRANENVIIVKTGLHYHASLLGASLLSNLKGG
ncbi:MAG: ROK family protein [Clostridia bacterium]|nr:ROK family protein [Clostridia bacterium]